MILKIKLIFKYKINVLWPFPIDSFSSNFPSSISTSWSWWAVSNFGECEISFCDEESDDLEESFSFKCFAPKTEADDLTKNTQEYLINLINSFNY